MEQKKRNMAEDFTFFQPSTYHSLMPASVPSLQRAHTKPDSLSCFSVQSRSMCWNGGNMASYLVQDIEKEETITSLNNDIFNKDSQLSQLNSQISD
jgi:hypothetical protein